MLYDKANSRLLRSSEVAAMIGIATRTVCLWAECDVIPALKLGRQWRFRRSDIARWLERHANDGLLQVLHPNGDNPKERRSGARPQLTNPPDL